MSAYCWSALAANYSNMKFRDLFNSIGTEFFARADNSAKSYSILFMGQLDPANRVDVFVKALELLQEQGVQFTADIIGDPTESTSKYAHDVRNLAAPLALKGAVTMRGAATKEEAAQLFRSHAIYCNLTSSGSFDKTILEAMASGCIVVTQSEALKEIVPETLLTKDDSPDATATALRVALTLGDEDARAIREQNRTYVEERHSLKGLMQRIIAALEI